MHKNKLNEIVECCLSGRNTLVNHLRMCSCVTFLTDSTNLFVRSHYWRFLWPPIPVSCMFRRVFLVTKPHFLAESMANFIILRDMGKIFILLFVAVFLLINLLTISEH